MDDTEKFKKYMKYFNKQLTKFQTDLNTQVLNKSLDDRLLVELAGSDKKLDRLKTCNEYAYLLSSLVFIYQKLNGDKDTSNVIRELGRIQSYMTDSERLSGKKQAASSPSSQNNEQRVNSSISQQNFQAQPQGTHIKFQENPRPSTEDSDAKKPDDNEVKSISAEILEKLNTKKLSASIKNKKSQVQPKKVVKP